MNLNNWNLFATYASSVYPYLGKEDAMAIISHKLKQNEMNDVPSDIKTMVQCANFSLNHQPKFKFIDLFAGIGGFRLALQNAGGECVFSSEWNKQAQETYFANFGEVPFGDITTDFTKSYIPNNFDILCGGFPCQPFSICGKKKGFIDTRGTLFFDICQILEQKKPQVCLLENVQHLTKHDKGKTFSVIVDSLLDLGYNVSYKVLNSKDFGLPQFRDRIFIVATRNGLFNFDKIKKSEPVCLEQFLDKIGNFEYLNKEDYTLIDENLVKKQEKSGLIFCGYRNKGIWKKGIRPNTEHLSRCHRQPNRIYSVLGNHPTLPSQETSGRFFIYLPQENAVRKLTLNECYKIMGYPSDYIRHYTIGEQYRQLGNSVAIPVIEAIINSILEQNLLDKSNTNEKNFRGNTKKLTFDF